MCEIGELEPCEVWSEMPRKARKQHKCSCCHGPILPGERYIVHFSIFEGDRTFEKLCGACEDARTEFCDDHLGGQHCNPSALRTLLIECTDDEESRLKWGPMLVAMQARSAVAQS